MLRSKRARKVAAVACGALFSLVVGLVAGYLIAKYVNTEQLTKCYEGRLSAASTSGGSLLPAGYQRGMPLNVSNLRQLPEPGTAEAQDLAAGSDTQGWYYAMQLGLSCMHSYLYSFPDDHIKQSLHIKLLPHQLIR